MINNFKGAYDFLSNFSPSEVTLDGETYPTVEHAYQAAKTLDPAQRSRIREAPTAAGAKKLGRTVQIRPDWDVVKIDVMRDLVRQKFHNPDLMEMLKATSPHELVEGNWWGDTFWGVCKGKGENWLGKILMEVRDGS